jgi:hypothetical protein
MGSHEETTSDGTTVERQPDAKCLPIVVWAPHFDEKSGGTIVLHLLAHHLRAMGHEVYLSNQTFPRKSVSVGSPLRRVVTYLSHVNRQRRYRRSRKRTTDLHMGRAGEVVTHHTMPVPTMPDMGGRAFIAVYPEIVDGNPLGAAHVVRWLLYHAGFHAPSARFTENELVFYYQRGFLAEGQDLPEDHLLQLHWIRDDIYRDLGLGNRQGTCRMVRKGKATFDPSMADGDRFGLLDSLSHREIAEVFNQCEVFVSHDLYTLYLYYAARCGCVPMVVPQPGLDGATWRKGYELSFGVAYGEAELDWARATREELMAEMARIQETELQMVRSFAGKLQAHFPSMAG